jgi:hypothetical protein
MHNFIYKRQGMVSTTFTNKSSSQRANQKERADANEECRTLNQEKRVTTGRQFSQMAGEAPRSSCWRRGTGGARVPFWWALGRMFKVAVNHRSILLSILIITHAKWYHSNSSTAQARCTQMVPQSIKHEALLVDWPKIEAANYSQSRIERAVHQGRGQSQQMPPPGCSQNTTEATGKLHQLTEKSF